MGIVGVKGGREGGRHESEIRSRGVRFQKTASVNGTPQKNLPR